MHFIIANIAQFLSVINIKIFMAKKSAKSLFIL